MKIEEEKLLDILNPGSATDKFKITIRLRTRPSNTNPEILELARKNKYFTEEGEGKFPSIYVSFYPEDADELHRFFQLVKDSDNARIYLNNRPAPYVHELWLFLMWFYRIK